MVAVVAVKDNIRPSLRLEEVRFGLVDAGAHIAVITARHATFKWKWHYDAYCLCLVSAGAYHIGSRGVSHYIAPGGVFLAEPGDVAVCHDTYDLVSCDVMFLDEKLVRRAARGATVRASMPHLRTMTSRATTLAADILRFHTCASNETPSLALDEALSRTVDRFLQICGERVRPAGNEHRAVRLIRSILHDRLSEMVRLDDIVAEVGFNKSYLIRCFTKTMGVPPHAYQRLVRLSRAKHLLKEGHSASTIATDLGFADQSHFIRKFREAVSITPAQYARAMLAPKGRRSQSPGHEAQSQ